MVSKDHRGYSHDSLPVVSVHGHQPCFWTSWPHHIGMSSIHLRIGRPGHLSPSTIPYTNDFSSRSSMHSTDIAEQLKLSLSDDVHHCPLPLHLSSDFIAGDVVLPVDFQYVSVTPHLECQQYFSLLYLLVLCIFVYSVRPSVRPSVCLSFRHVPVLCPVSEQCRSVVDFK